MKDFSLRPCLHLMRRKNGLKKQAASPTGKNCFGRARGSRTDYRRYRLSASEWAANGAVGAALAGLVAYTFYHSFSLFLFLLPFGLIGLPLCNWLYKVLEPKIGRFGGKRRQERAAAADALEEKEEQK